MNKISLRKAHQKISKIILENEYDTEKYMVTLNTLYDYYNKVNDYRAKQCYRKKLILYIEQKGRCRVSGKILSYKDITIHHIIPKRMSIVVDDINNIQNLCLVDKKYHNIIHKDYLKLQHKKHVIFRPSVPDYELVNKLDTNHLHILNYFRYKDEKLPILI